MPLVFTQQIRAHFFIVAGLKRLRIHETRPGKTQYIVAITVEITLQFGEGDISRI